MEIDMSFSVSIEVQLGTRPFSGQMPYVIGQSPKRKEARIRAAENANLAATFREYYAQIQTGEVLSLEEIEDYEKLLRLIKKRCPHKVFRNTGPFWSEMKRVHAKGR